MKPQVGGVYRGRSISSGTEVVGELLGVLRWPDGSSPWAVISHPYGHSACEYRTLVKESNDE